MHCRCSPNERWPTGDRGAAFGAACAAAGGDPTEREENAVSSCRAGSNGAEAMTDVCRSLRRVRGGGGLLIAGALSQPPSAPSTPSTPSTYSVLPNFYAALSLSAVHCTGCFCALPSLQWLVVKKILVSIWITLGLTGFKRVSLCFFCLF